MNHYECQNLFKAGKSLLTKSGLVRYYGDSFVSNNNEDDVEKYWRETFAPEFGRYMAWVWFSVGAENLVKAALVCNELVEGKEQVLNYPIYSHNTSRASWIDQVLQSSKPPIAGFGMLGEIWKSKLDRLSKYRSIEDTKSKELKAAYRYLTEAIRNRDAHSYIENQRTKDFPAVEGIFVPAFNTLVQTMNNRGHFKTNGNQ